MCGIAGIFKFNSKLVDPDLIHQMNLSQQHRGPDADGIWRSKNQRLGLGHRRLSILDLSEQANQPMEFQNGRYTISYNGEIYNYLELKQDLAKLGHQFKTKTDTEVILAMYAQYGKDCLKQFDGMFSFAIWDETKQELFCARDRFGEKPFYYYHDAEQLVFASEIKALWCAGIKKEIQEESIFRYLMYGVTNSGEQNGDSFYKGVLKLPPAQYMLIGNEGKIERASYWELNINPTTDISFEEASDKFYQLLKDSVHKRLRSDVPVGTSLSGGLDSSSIVYLMNEELKNNSLPVHTFTIRYPDFEKDEGRFVDLIDNDISINRTDVFPTEKEIAKEFENLQALQDEPFGSFSISSQNLIYKAASSKGIKVLLDGQGADEVLAGYSQNRAVYYKKLRKRDRTKFIEEIEAYELRYGEKFDAGSFAERAVDSLPLSKDILRKGIQKLRKDNSPYFLGIHPDIVSKYKQISNPLSGSDSFRESLAFSIKEKGLTELLRYADRNAMHHSVEVRLPFLSHHLVEFAFSLPDEFLIRNAWTKCILREAMKDLLPSEICWRKDKIGFAAPEAKLLATEHFRSMIDSSVKDLQSKGIIQERNPLLEWRYVMLSYYLK